jgi:hypothetical protein
MKETVMAGELSSKAIEALRELNSRSSGERPLMLEWDVESALKQRDFVEEAASGGWRISERGREYARKMNS